MLCLAHGHRTDVLVRSYRVKRPSDRRIGLDDRVWSLEFCCVDYENPEAAAQELVPSLSTDFLKKQKIDLVGSGGCSSSNHVFVWVKAGHAVCESMWLFRVLVGMHF